MQAKFLLYWTCAIMGAVLPWPSLAETLPGPADAGRIQPEEKIIVPDRATDNKILVPSIAPSVPVPEAAKSFHFTLKSVTIENMSAFTREQMADIYAPYIDKEVTLDIAWLIAGSITERYRNAGYFLSRAYVPQQHIANGTLTIKVMEGGIGNVELPDEIKDNRIIKDYVSQLLAQKPTTSQAMESFLLRLNDLPGYAFRAVLSPLKGEQQGVVNLTIVPSPKDGKGTVSFDNFSSRYLGPNEVFASYSTSLLSLQQTTVSGLNSLPFDKLHYGMLDHTIALAPDFTLELNGGVTKAYPGYRLEAFDINSRAISESGSINYQWIRQRQESRAEIYLR